MTNINPTTRTPRSVASIEVTSRYESGELHPLADGNRLNGKPRVKCFSELCHDRGQRYARCDFDNFEIYDDNQKPIVEKLKRFCQEMPDRLWGGGGLVLAGGEGGGKDHLLFACSKSAILDHGFRMKWVDGVSLFANLRAAIRDQTEKESIDSLIAPDILAISDPAPPQGSLTDYQLSILRQVVDRRYSGCKSTWATMNFASRESANEVFTAPLFGRLIDDAEVVWCNWRSYRKSAGAR